MFTNEQLQKLIDGKMVGDIYPYDTNDEQAVLNHLKMIQAEIERLPNIHCEPDVLHFGSGYASYVEWFIYTDQDIQISEEYGLRIYEKEGLMVNISLLAPVILIGVGEKSDTIRIETDEEIGGSKTHFSEIVQLEIPGKYSKLHAIIERLFMKYHYAILQKQDVIPRLSFRTEIPTIYRAPHEYMIFDAIFYWED